MKKVTYILATAFLITLAFYSCKKEYHCSCSFNNTVVFTKDLGNQYKKNAKDQCNAYDSTMQGEVWQCGIY